jgi:hypothetical protein
MSRNAFLTALLIAASAISGCASVPMASVEQDASLKTFANPPAGQSGIYIYRNSFVGQALKKNIYIDGKLLGETANKTYFYTTVTPGSHQLSTESEFSDNALALQAEGGRNYFVEQIVKMGVFVGGAKMKLVSEQEGRDQVMQCSLAR